MEDSRSGSSLPLRFVRVWPVPGRHYRLSSDMLWRTSYMIPNEMIRLASTLSRARGVAVALAWNSKHDCRESLRSICAHTRRIRT